MLSWVGCFVVRGRLWVGKGARGIVGAWDNGRDSYNNVTSDCGSQRVIHDHGFYTRRGGHTNVGHWGQLIHVQTYNTTKVYKGP